MTTLAETHTEHALRMEVGRVMLDLLGAQYYLSFIWNEPERRFEEGACLNISPATLSAYYDHYQFVDPITFKLQRYRQAKRVTDVMPQTQLMRTEAFNDSLAPEGLHWGINFHAWDGERIIGDLRIWRDRRRDNFGEEELALLDIVGPAFVAALRRSQGRHEPLVAVADTATAVLSAREKSVAVRAARGLPDKLIAQQLGISMTTVRTHLGHAFRKLGVANRTMLSTRITL